MPPKPKIVIENINTPGRTERVDEEKYLAMREAMLAAIPAEGPGLTQAEMAEAIRPLLPQTLWPNGEKSMWWIKTVQLDLEAKGLLTRDAKAKPLRWRRVK